MNKILNLVWLVFCSLFYNTVNAESLEYSSFIFPPYSLEGQKGSGDKLAQAILDKAGIKVHYNHYPWARHVDNLKLGKVAFGNSGITENDVEITNFIYTPITYPAQVTALFSSMQVLSGLPSIEALAGTRVGIIRRATLGPHSGLLDPNSKVNIQEVDSFQSGFRMLQNNRIDYFVSFLGPTVQIKKQTNEFNDIKFRKMFSVNGHFIVISKVHPLASELNDKITKAYKKLLDAGKIDTTTGLLKGANHEY